MNLEVISQEEYRARPGLSSSTLKIFGTRSPYHAMDALKNPTEPTPAMIMGSAIHARILEPDTFAAQYAGAPVCDRRTKDGKALYEAFAADAKGKTILSAEDFETVHIIGERVLNDPEIRAELTGGQAEGSLFWTDEASGVACKARPDYYRAHDNVLIDVKTTENGDADSFSRVIANLKYHWQAQFYARGIAALTGTPVTAFKFLVIEKKPPFGYGLYTLHFSALDKAEEDIQRLLVKYRECDEANHWPSYPKQSEVYLPAWALGSLE